jgi:tetratricopeptide (TPR) repeat protein
MKQIRDNFFNVILLTMIASLLTACNKELTCDELKKNYFSLITGLHTRKDSVNFIERLRQLGESEKSCNKAFQVQGYLNLSLKNYPKARDNFEASLANDSFNAFTCYYYAMLLNFEQQNAKAIYYLNRALDSKGKGGVVMNNNPDFSREMDVDLSQIIYYSGVVLFEMKKYASAKNIFLRCWNDSSNKQGVAQYLAAIYNYTNNKDSACFFYRQAMLEGVNYVNEDPMNCD